MQPLGGVRLLLQETSDCYLACGLPSWLELLASRQLELEVKPRVLGPANVLYNFFCYPYFIGLRRHRRAVRRAALCLGDRLCSSPLARGRLRADTFPNRLQRHRRAGESSDSRDAVRRSTQRSGRRGRPEVVAKCRQGAAGTVGQAATGAAELTTASDRSQDDGALAVRGVRRRGRDFRAKRDRSPGSLVGWSG